MHKSNKSATAALGIFILTIASKSLDLSLVALITSKFGLDLNTNTYFDAITTIGMITGYLISDFILH